MAYSASLGVSPANFAITASVPTFQILGISPATAGNRGKTTMSIRGVDIPGDIHAVLVGPQGVRYEAAATYCDGLDTIYPTFDLTNAPAGAYDVRLELPGGMFTQVAAVFHVVEGVGGRLNAEISVPSSVRTGTAFTVWLEYKNVGDSDIAAPLLYLTSAATPLTYGTGPTNAPGEALQLLGISSSGPAAILRPGQSERIPLQSVGAMGALHFSLNSLTINETPIVWADFKNSMRLDSISVGEWNAVFPLLAARLGNTWSEYYATLARNATRLGEQGRRSPRVVDAIRMELAKVRGEGVSAIGGTLINTATGANRRRNRIRAARRIADGFHVDRRAWSLHIPRLEASALRFAHRELPLGWHDPVLGDFGDRCAWHRAPRSRHLTRWPSPRFSAGLGRAGRPGN